MKHIRLLVALALASFFCASANAQNPGAVTNHAFAIGKGAGTTGYTSLLCGSAQLAVGQAAADPICRTITGDVTITAAGVTAIGASKVTNAQLATMDANTTKCNATAGTANPTDCTGATMRTNLGLVIGTNVEAWDTDLDCLAALSSTGVISRTGSGTCSAGALALSGLATGTQDTVIGYWGSTTATAIAINNCTGALTYSTTTHTFGCNTTSGTGTVTSVTCFGSAITTSGTCATAATKSDQETGTSTTAVVTPSQQQSHDSANKVIANCSVSGGVVTCGFTYGVSSITRSSAGQFVVNFSTNFASTSYACEANANAGIGTVFLANTGISAKSVSAISLYVGQASTFAAADPAEFSINCQGRQ
jgi:hypothetical protein